MIILLLYKKVLDNNSALIIKSETLPGNATEISAVNGGVTVNTAESTFTSDNNTILELNSELESDNVGPSLQLVNRSKDADLVI